MNEEGRKLGQFLAVGETCKPIFWFSAELKEETSDSSGFPAYMILFLRLWAGMCLWPSAYKYNFKVSQRDDSAGATHTSTRKSLCWWDLGRVFDHSVLACAFSFKVEISSRTLIPLFRSGSVHSGSTSWDHCGRMFPDRLRVSSFPDRFPHYAWTAA